MICPLCGGPLHVDDARRFVCERGHELDHGDVQEAAGVRVMVALWMAIDALESRATALRSLASMGPASDGDHLLHDASEAEKDATVLRTLAARAVRNPDYTDRRGQGDGDDT
jgi:hypothetical protein